MSGIEIFDLLSADLATVVPGYPGKIMCPFCLRMFDHAALDDKTDAGLTEEHIITGAVGGRVITLTCKKCNNAHGSALEGDLVRMVRARDWMAGDLTLRGSVRAGDTQVPMKFSWRPADQGATLKIPGAKPDTLQRFRKNIAAAMLNQGQMHLNINFKFSEVNAQRAILRMGYLALFRALGYSYVLSEAASWVRGLIGGADDARLRMLLPELNNVNGGATEQIVVSPVGSERGIIAYFVLLRLDQPKPWHRAVILPAPSIPEDSVLVVLSEVMSSMNGNTYAMRNSA